MRVWTALAIAMLVLSALAAPARAQTRVVTGQAGILAEWDLTATVTEQTKGHWSGPLSLKHVGLCSVEGEQEKSGELRLLVSEPSDEISATLRIEGEACTFTGRLKDGYDGTMTCPGRRDVPMMLFLQ